MSLVQASSYSLLKKWSKFSVVLYVAFCMKIGNYFERFVIITSSLHRDYLPDNGNNEFTDSILYIIGMVFLQGMVIAILTLGVFEMSKRKKNCA